MKKIISMGLTACLLLSLTLTSCKTNNDPKDQENSGTSNSDTTNPQKSEYETLAEEYATQISIGNFDTIYDNLSDSVKKQVTKEKLTTDFKEFAKTLGTYQNIHKTYSIKSDASTVVFVISKYEKIGIKTQISFDSTKKIIGLYNDYYNIKDKLDSSDDFEEIAIKVGEGENKLEGVLTLPKKVSNPPVAIMIQGSGQSDMDLIVGSSLNAPFKDIAHGLAQQGVATIRYNKRFYQYPETASPQVNIQDEYLNDINSAVKLAKENGKVNPNKIFLLGHSQGGMIAPKIALDNADVKGFISLAGSIRPLEDIQIDQIKAGLLSDKTATQEQKDAYLKQMQEQADKIKTLTENDKNLTFLNINSEYWYSLNQLKVGEAAKQLNKPMLILQGSADFQVSKEKDYKLWQDTLKGKNNVTFKLYDGLNHLFTKTTGKNDITEYDVKNNVDSVVVSDIASFINKN